jgi:type I restriction enzyme, S subunit
MAINQDIKACIPRQRVDARYFSYFIHGHQRELLTFWRQQGATVESLNFDAVKAASVVVPSFDEQHAIVGFLDKETAKIDNLILKERALIQKLREKRSVLISRVVTRGLPPDAARAAGLDAQARLKPSGIDWIREIPEHWQILKFSREVRIAEGQVDPEVEPYASMLLIAPNHIESGTGKLISMETADQQAAESGKYICNAGDVVYSKIRPALAKLTLSPSDSLCSGDMYPLHTVGNLSNRYLFWLLLSPQFTAWSILESDRVAMPKINRDTLGELRMPVPPMQEQTAIDRYLDTETAKIDRMIEKVEEAISRFREYRASLITAAVTGRIDLREAVPSGEPPVLVAAG